jgi:hypothetical protein
MAPVLQDQQVVHVDGDTCCNGSSTPCQHALLEMYTHMR